MDCFKIYKWNKPVLDIPTWLKKPIKMLVKILPFPAFKDTENSYFFTTFGQKFLLVLLFWPNPTTNSTLLLVCVAIAFTCSGAILCKRRLKMLRKNNSENLNNLLGTYNVHESGTLGPLLSNLQWTFKNVSSIWYDSMLTINKPS